MINVWAKNVLLKLADQNLGLVLKLGFSDRKLVETLSQSPVKKIVVADPNPQLAQNLQRHFIKDKTVTILATAVSGAIGPATLRSFNLSQANSLREPTGLKTLFPRLLETGQTQVQTQNIETLLQQVDIDDEADHALILGAAGEELAIIKQLSSLSVLRRFAHVIVPLPSLPLYEGSSAGTEIQSLLERTGFVIEDQDKDDPDLSLTHFRLNRFFAMLIEESDALRNAQKVSDDQLNAQKMHLKELNAARDQESAAHTETKKKNQTFKNRILELDRDYQRIKIENETAHKQNQKLEKSLEEKNEEIVDLTLRVSKAQEELRRAEGQLSLLKELMLKSNSS